MGHSILFALLWGFFFFVFETHARKTDILFFLYNGSGVFSKYGIAPKYGIIDEEKIIIT